MGHEVSDCRLSRSVRLVGADFAFPLSRFGEASLLRCHPAPDGVDVPLATSGRLEPSFIEETHELLETGAQGMSEKFVGLLTVFPEANDFVCQFAGGVIVNDAPRLAADMLPADGSGSELLPLLLDLFQGDFGTGADFGEFELLHGSKQLIDDLPLRRAGVDVQVQNHDGQQGFLKEFKSLAAFHHATERPVELRDDDGIAWLHTAHQLHEFRPSIQRRIATHTAVAEEAAPACFGGECPAIDTQLVSPLGNVGLGFERNILFTGTHAPVSEALGHPAISVVGGEQCR